MARLAQHGEVALDIGWAQTPNQFLSNKTVVGFDVDDRVLPNNYKSSVTGKVEEIANLLPSESFDVILAGELIEHLETPYEFLRDCLALLRPGGKLILSTPNPNSPIERLLTLTLNRKLFFTREHTLIYPQRWLIRMLESSGFCRVELYSGGFPVPIIGTIPFPRPWCHQTIATAWKRRSDEASRA